jgi:hypothetical protein
VECGQLQSALLNVIINALDAAQPGDPIGVSTGIGQSNEKADRGAEIAVV